MEDILNVVGSVKGTEKPQLTVDKDIIISAPHKDTHVRERRQTKISTPKDALDILKSQPEKPEVVAVLRFLDPTGPTEGNLNITATGLTAAQILHVLVSVTIPDHWNNLSADNELSLEGKPLGAKHRARAALLRCLNSVPGIGSLLAQLRKLLAGQDGKGSTSQAVTKDLLTVLSSLLKPQGLLLHIYSDISKHAASPVQKQVMWKELISFLATGKILSTVAEASKTIDNFANSKLSWMAEGPAYASWLGGEISCMVIKFEPGDAEAWKYLSSFVGRALSIGYISE